MPIDKARFSLQIAADSQGAIFKIVTVYYISGLLGNCFETVFI